ncbi:MAG: hypothetical protein PHQ59_02435 [Candidatus Daviesbacteria bacterium]|nr:hypothetical protein [Candidatus Daviesbacteria bacterium]
MKTCTIILGIIVSLFLLTPLAQAGFSFSVPQTNINENQEIEALVNLSIQNQGNKVYYLEGAFKREGATNYFGLTWNDTSWINYSSSNSDKNLKSITTSPEGSWSGILKVKLDTNSSQFQGSGNYNLKINRFTATGTTPTSSDNDITLSITTMSTPTPTTVPTSTNTPTPTKTPTPTSSKTPTPTKKVTTPTSTSSQKSTITPSIQDNQVSLPESILGSSTGSADISPTPVKTKDDGFSFKSLVFIAGGIILVLLGIFALTFIAKDRFKKL